MEVARPSDALRPSARVNVKMCTKRQQREEQRRAERTWRAPRRAPYVVSAAGEAIAARPDSGAPDMCSVARQSTTVYSTTVTE